MRDWFIEQMAMYSAYHRDKRNQATHHLGVPMIVFSLFLALTLVPLFPVAGYVVTAGTLFFLTVMTMYLVSVPSIGVVAFIIYAIVLYLAEMVAATQSTQMVWSIFGVFFVGGWIIQFIGHAFEGRRPALLDNALQALMAPSFLIAETLFALGQLTWLKAAMDERMVHYLPRLEPEEIAEQS